MNELVPYLGPAVALIALVISLAGNRSKAQSAKIAAVNTRVDDALRRIDAVEDRTLKLEGSVIHLPDKDTTHELEVSMLKLSGQVEVLSEQIKPIAAMAGRIQEAMIEKAMS